MASPRCGLPDYILTQPASLNLNSNEKDKKKSQTKTGPASYQAGLQTFFKAIYFHIISI